MTEGELLTIQRYQAIWRGHQKDIPRFTDMLERLLNSVYNHHFRAIDKHLDGGTVKPEDLTKACAAFAWIMAKMAAGLPPDEAEMLPKFLRITERADSSWEATVARAKAEGRPGVFRKPDPKLLEDE